MASMEMSSPGTPSSRKKTGTERAAVVAKRKTMQERPLAISKKKAAPQRNLGLHKKGPAADRVSTKSRPVSTLQSLQSLPSEFRFSGGSLSEEGEVSVNLSHVFEDKVEEDVDGFILRCFRDLRFFI